MGAMFKRGKRRLKAAGLGCASEYSNPLSCHPVLDYVDVKYTESDGTCGGIGFDPAPRQGCLGLGLGCSLMVPESYVRTGRFLSGLCRQRASHRPPTRRVVVRGGAKVAQSAASGCGHDVHQKPGGQLCKTR